MEKTIRETQDQGEINLDEKSPEEVVADVSAENLDNAIKNIYPDIKDVEYGSPGADVPQKQPGKIVRLDNSHDQLIAMAIDKDFDIEKFKMLIEMKKDHENNEARKAFNAAMVRAQSNMPIVPKDKFNDHTKSRYSSYEMILKHTQPVYTNEGFAITMYEGVTTVPDNIRICANIMHEDGHTETMWVDMPIDNKGSAGKVNKTGPHAKKSSITYGRGTLMCTIFNIPTGDGDDGNVAGGMSYISEDNAMTIQSLIEEIGMSNSEIGRFLKVMKAEKVEKITDYNDAVKKLKEFREKSGK